MKKTVAPVLFSGHNDRAVIALCRFFASIKREFFIVASHANEAIFQTAWASQVLMQRRSSILSIDLLNEVAISVQSHGLKPYLCPTSEFLNRFMLANQQVVQAQGWHWLFPMSEIYEALSDKFRSPDQVERMIGLRTPHLQEPSAWHAPCVLKPKSNLFQERIHYPYLCATEQQLQKALEGIDASQWFSQTWVDGQSFYLCAYIDGMGGWDGFWQENLLQQPDGKSIVLARTCNNPGLDVDQLMRSLHEMCYRGPFMMEVIRDQQDILHYIEINPRFWGPLDLARKACPKLLKRFMADVDGIPLAMKPQPITPNLMYAWAYGARHAPLKVYPGAVSLLAADLVEFLLNSYDVYAQPDTQALTLKY